jgi:nucleoside phosphorylase
MMATENWRLAYRDRFRSLYNEEFQSWFETLLRALHTAVGDFQAICKTSGDRGLDGFVINSQLVYQVYAPARINELRDGETAAKIRSDFAKAQSTLSGKLKEWTFVHNHPEGKIGQLSAEILSEIKRNHPDIGLNVLDIDSLWTRLEKLGNRALEKLFGPAKPSGREGLWTPDSNPTAIAEDRTTGAGGGGRNARPRYVFLQFLNPEIRALYQTDAGWSARQLHREWIRISKYALLVADKGLAIPASYVFEVPELSTLLEELQPVRKQGLLHVVSPTPDLVLYAGQKRKEYRDELALFPRYAGEDDAQPANGQLIWVPRVARSASGDIAAAWRGELEHADGLWRDLLRAAESRQLALPSLLESAISTVPDKLEGRAFIYRFAKQLLPFTPDTAGESRLKLLISREYLRSYLLELGAAVLVETPIGNLDCGIERYKNVQTISWRVMADCFETLRIRAHVEALSWRDLSRLRVQPVLHWLIGLVLTPSREGRNVFEEVVTLSRFRAPEPRTRSGTRRLYDIVTDQIWRFQSAGSPVLYSYDWSEIAIEGALRPSLLPKRRRRRASESRQLTMLPDMCDVGIVVALPEEFRELQRQLAERWKPLYDDETATDYYLFTSDGPEGAGPYSCVTTFAGSMGPAKAALLTEKLRTRWRVRVLVNVGIAGALDDDVRLGDVVAGSVADNYLERAKAVDAPGGDGFAFDLAGEPFRSTRALVDACAHLEFAHPDLFAEWRQACQAFLNGLPAEQLAALRAAGFLAALPIFAHGHVACGPSVGASVVFKRWLKKRDRSYLTLDMESGGVLMAVYEAARVTEGLVLRGVSDFADERKTELDRIGRGELRRSAMHNALQFLWSLMRAGRLPRAKGD